MIVTIDGPAGAGKSSAARGLAERLGFDFLDTGAMYRAVTLAALRANVAATDEPRLVALVNGIEIVVARGVTTLNGEDVSEAIRTPEVTSQVRHFADKAVVRRRLTEWQRQVGAGADLVTEGRDQGTIVFPDAECKFFLTASEAVRAARRRRDFARQGRDVALDAVLAEQRARDQQDAERALAPLRPAPDAQVIDTSNLDAAATIDLLERLVRQRRGGGGGDASGGKSRTAP